MEHRQKIRKWLEAHTSEMLHDLAELVAIPSVKGEPAPQAPFGEAPAAALRKMLETGRRYGLTAEELDGYAGSLRLGGEARLGILAHLDVVPAGEGWLHEPFRLTPDESDGRLYGRGTSDDKGPAVAALYAMRAVQELGIPLSHGVQLILGTDEENGSSDLAYYMQHRTLPPLVYTPDGDYPVITCEKGMARLAFTAAFGEDSQVLSIRAGEAVNAVPPLAEAVLRDISIDDFLGSRRKDYPGAAIGCFVDDEEHLHITVDGRSAHASTPEQGRNALTCLLELLVPVLGENAQADAIRLLAARFPYGETDGQSCGAAAQDAESGALTLVLSVMDADAHSLCAKADTRFPLCCSGAAVTEKLREALAPLKTNVLMCDEPHHTDENSEFVRKLLEIYTEVTGEPGMCLAIGGGTYVHHIEGGVAFGAMFPGEDIHMHGADEFIRRDALLLDAEMMALTITELCGCAL